ncbi:hypothetical protein BDV93DRAFT_576306 [Ceratobasidium sp. AG-I]|nr:hypothetical protein BDV93DRAFT_576306 [Ceratobasidium sp. AG-I]
MTTAFPPGYSRLFATGLFLSMDLPSGPSGSRSATPTPITTAPHTPLLEAATVAGNYTGATTLAVPSFRSSAQRSARRPKLAALRTYSGRTSSSNGSGPPSAGVSSSVPPSPRVVRRRRSSVTLSQNPIAAIKSPTRSAGMSGRAQSFLQAMGSPDKEKRSRQLDAVGEQSAESISAEDMGENAGAGKSKASARSRRALVARKPPPTAPLPVPPNQPRPNLPTLTLNATFPSPNSLSSALAPSHGVLPLPTPSTMNLELLKSSFDDLHRQSARSLLVNVGRSNTTPSPHTSSSLLEGHSWFAARSGGRPRLRKSVATTTGSRDSDMLKHPVEVTCMREAAVQRETSAQDAESKVLVISFQASLVGRFGPLYQAAQLDDIRK